MKPRLAGVASCIAPDSVVADIGTDHGYLPVYLIQQRICPKVIGTEKNPENLQEARKNIERYNLFDVIELRQGNGFIPIKDTDIIDTVVIAGMGGRTVIDILETAKGDFGNIRKFIFQPLRDLKMLRFWLVENGFRISAERLAFEQKRYYIIIVAERGRQAVRDPFHMEIGPMLIQQGDPLLESYLKHRIKICRFIANDLKKAGTERGLKKLTYYREKEKKLKELLSLVVTGSGNDRANG